MKSKYQGAIIKGDPVYYIVNPAGAVHSVAKDLFTEKLIKDRRYRAATDAEIEMMKEAKIQTSGNPIAPPKRIEDVYKPFVPEPAKPDIEVAATNKAREYAAKHGVDLNDIKNPSGADGAVLLIDVKKHIDG